MEPLALARLNTAALVIAVAAVVGHLALPFAPHQGVWPRLAFTGALFALGALRGWRDAVLRDVRTPRAVALTALLFGVLATGAVLAGYAVMHGSPVR